MIKILRSTAKGKVCIMGQKVLNICVNGIYTDGYTYHENLLPKYHKKNGNEVYVLASQYEFTQDGLIQKSHEDAYVDSNGIVIRRLPIIGDRPYDYRLKRFKNFYGEIEAINPDVIFCHLFQFLDSLEVVKYVNRHPEVKLYVDSHADRINSAKSFFSMQVLHKGLWKFCAKRLAKKCLRFYGVLPARVEFLRDVYKVPKEKAALLVMGVDDEEADRASKEQTKSKTREKYNILRNEFVIVTGGKITRSKSEVITLMRAMENINARLIVFGPVSDDITKEFDEAMTKKNITYAGWLSSEESYDLFAISNLVVFPSTHSVYWEQVAGQGIPMIVRHWDGIEHIDLGGNIIFLDDVTEEKVFYNLKKIIDNSELYNSMKENAIQKGRMTFSYKSIAEKSIT